MYALACGNLEPGIFGSYKTQSETYGLSHPTLSRERGHFIAQRDPSPRLPSVRVQRHPERDSARTLGQKIIWQS